MPAKAGTQGGPALHLRPWAPASAGATEKEEVGTICLVHTTSPLSFVARHFPSILSITEYLARLFQAL